jgi:hypothetical protein
VRPGAAAGAQGQPRMELNPVSSFTSLLPAPDGCPSPGTGIVATATRAPPSITYHLSCGIFFPHRVSACLPFPHPPLLWRHNHDLARPRPCLSAICLVTSAALCDDAALSARCAFLEHQDGEKKRSPQPLIQLAQALAQKETKHYLHPQSLFSPYLISLAALPSFAPITQPGKAKRDCPCLPPDISEK